MYIEPILAWSFFHSSETKNGHPKMSSRYFEFTTSRFHSLTLLKQVTVGDREHRKKVDNVYVKGWGKRGHVARPGIATPDTQ